MDEVGKPQVRPEVNGRGYQAQAAGQPDRQRHAVTTQDQSPLLSSGDVSVTAHGRLEASHDLGVRLPTVMADTIDIGASLRAIVIRPCVRPPHLAETRLSNHLVIDGHLLQRLQGFGLVTGNA